MKTSKFATLFGRMAIAFTVVLTACGIWFLLGYVEFHNRLKELKANGSLISLDEIVHEVSDPQKDALTFLRQAFPVAKEFLKVFRRESNGQASVEPEALRKFAELNSKYPKFFPLISAAANSPEMSFGFYATQSTFYSILEMHSILKVMHWKGQILLSHGDQLGAIKLAIEMLKLGQLVEQPFLVNTILGTAFQTEACHLMFDSILIGAVDTELQQQIRQSLEQLELDEAHLDALRGELSLFVNHAVGSGLQDEASGSQWAILAPMMSFGLPTAFGNRYLDQVELAFERARQPLSIQFPDGRKANWSILPDPIGNRTEFFNHFRNRFGRIKVNRQCVLILLALLAEASSANRTEWSLDYLKSIGVSEKEAIDPFNDKPLIIRHQDGRWAIYSVGPNQQDDQGQSGTDDIGLGLIQNAK